MKKKLAAILAASFFLACSPSFTTTNPDEVILGKADIQAMLGSWIYRFEKLSIQLDIELLKVRYTQICESAENKTQIQTESRVVIKTGFLTLIDGIGGTIHNGNLNCGLDFAAADYKVGIKDNILSLQTKSGLLKFERLPK